MDGQKNVEKTNITNNPFPSFICHTRNGGLMDPPPAAMSAKFTVPCLKEELWANCGIWTDWQMRGPRALKSP